MATALGKGALVLLPVPEISLFLRRRPAAVRDQGHGLRGPPPIALLLSARARAGGRSRSDASAYSGGGVGGTLAGEVEGGFAASRRYSLQREEEETLLMLGLFCDRALKCCEAAAEKTESFRAMVKSSVPRELADPPLDGESVSDDGCLPWGDERPRRPFVFERSAEQERSCRLVRRLNELLHAKRVEITDDIMAMLRAREDCRSLGSGVPPASPSASASAAESAPFASARFEAMAARFEAVAARFEAGAADDAVATTSWYISHPCAEIEYLKQQNSVCAVLVGDLRKYKADMQSVDEQ